MRTVGIGVTIMVNSGLKLYRLLVNIMALHFSGVIEKKERVINCVVIQEHYLRKLQESMDCERKLLNHRHILNICDFYLLAVE